MTQFMPLKTLYKELVKELLLLPILRISMDITLSNGILLAASS